MKWFKNKRKQIAKTLPKNSMLILESLPVYYRQVDVVYPYRQESNFYYLTGFEQASSLFLLFPNKARSILFISDKDPIKEKWDGILMGAKELQKQYLIDEVYYLSQLEKQLPLLLKGKKTLFYSPVNPSLHKKIKSLKIKLESAQNFLSPFRRIKDKTEISSMRKAISITNYSHKQIAKALKPGINARQLHGIFIKSIMEKGSPREAYGSIIASGENANTLHYTKNNSPCKKGELLLVDAGAEYQYYSADITRVYPVSGKFTKIQKLLYENLLKLQKSLIEEVKPGMSLDKINQKMQEGVTKILINLKVLKGSVRDNLTQKNYQIYCPHSVGHLLGLDVHDVTFSRQEESLLKPGMVLTIEPGIYFSHKHTKIPKELRGIGLRIEDNILVTSTGKINLSKQIPKELHDIEKLCSSS